MTSITLRFEPCVAKFWNYIHQEYSPDKKSLSPLMRSMIHSVVEARYIFEPAPDLFNRREETEVGLNEIYSSELVSKVIVHIYTENRAGDLRTQFNNNQLWIPPTKMFHLNRILKELINEQINMEVSLAIERNGQIKDAILSVFDRFDFDDLDYKFDSALKMNQRYREKRNEIINE
jgi:hypothetical protein